MTRHRPRVFQPIHNAPNQYPVSSRFSLHKRRQIQAQPGVSSEIAEKKAVSFLEFYYILYRNDEKGVIQLILSKIILTDALCLISQGGKKGNVTIEFVNGFLYTITYFHIFFYITTTLISTANIRFGLCYFGKCMFRCSYLQTMHIKRFC